MFTYAYARVSTQDQNLSRQLDAFIKFGIPPKFIYCDKKSGKDFERENYTKPIKRLKKRRLIDYKINRSLGSQLRCYYR